MKLTIITYQFKPLHGPRALRWTALVNEFLHMGYDITIVTSSHPDRQATKFDEQLKIVEVPDPVAKAKTGLTTSSTIGKHARGAGKLKSWLRRMFFPDQHILWAIRASAKIKNVKSDVMISSSYPFSTHVIGFHRRKSTQKWICELGDPFSFASSYSWSGGLMKWIGRKFETHILKRADKIVVMNEGTKDAYKSKLNLKALVIPQYFDTRFNFVDPEFESGKYHIVYTGIFYPIIREPDALLSGILDVLNSRNDLVFHFYGPLNSFDYLRNQYSHVSIKFYGHRSRAECLSAVQSADLVLNIANKESVQVPSKLVDYIYINPNILSVVHNANSDTVYREFGQIVENDASAIHNYFAHTSFDKTVSKELESVKSRYSKERVVGLYKSLIEESVF